MHAHAKNNHGKRSKRSTTPSSPPSPLRDEIIKVLGLSFTVFSGDKKPSEEFIKKSQMLQKYRNLIAFSEEWVPKAIGLQHQVSSLQYQLSLLGVTPDPLSFTERTFFFYKLPSVNPHNIEEFKKSYNNMQRAHPGYPKFSDVFCFIGKTPVGKPYSNVEVHLQDKFKEPVVSVESCFPGTFELGVTPAELAKELSKLSAEQKAELASLGLEEFMKKYPGVIRPVRERSVWAAPPTPWGSGNKPPPLFLDIKPHMLVQMAHPPVKVCACGMTSSNLRVLLGRLPNYPVDVINRDGSRLKKAPTSQDFKHCLVCACPGCNRGIRWSSLVTKHAQAFCSSKWVEGIFKTLVEKARLLFPSKECYSCNDLTPYDDQKHDECVNTHSECICQGCESERTTHRNSEYTAGSLISRQFHQCNLCKVWHPTDMGQYLKEVPENHQVRRCLECTCLFHQALECGADEIPPICQPCADKKERERRFVYCPWCDVGCERETGCDLICCGCDYSGNPILMAGQHVGCGKRFCYGCGVKFHDNLMDWTCSCYIEGTYPPQYRPAETSTCHQDRYGNSYSPQDSESPPESPSPIIVEDTRLDPELLELYFQRHREASEAISFRELRSTRPRMVQDLDMEIDPEILSDFFSTFDE